MRISTRDAGSTPGIDPCNLSLAVIYKNRSTQVPGVSVSSRFANFASESIAFGYIHPTHTTTTPIRCLQLRPSLRLLQYVSHAACFHHIPFNFQLSTHEQLLRIRLALNKLPKVLITQRQRDCCFLALGRKSLAHCTRLLEINIPRVCLGSWVLERKGEDGAALFDRVFTVRVRSGKGARDLVKGGGRGERV
jgi:hypothetical protein